MMIFWMKIISNPKKVVCVVEVIFYSGNVTSVQSSLCGRSNILLRKCYFCSKKVKNKLFSSYCSNVYLCSLRANYRKATKQHFIVSCNNAFRIMHSLTMFRRSASLMFVSSGTDCCNTRFRKCMYNLMCSKNSTNNIVQSIEYSNVYNTSVLCM